MITSEWNDPSISPTKIGEYRAVITSVNEGHNIPETVRRYWNGEVWSDPYHSTWPEDLIEETKKVPSRFIPFWQEI